MVFAHLVELSISGHLLDIQYRFYRGVLFLSCQDGERNRGE